jgi:hypothetical protein
VRQLEEEDHKGRDARQVVEVAAAAAAAATTATTCGGAAGVTASHKRAMAVPFVAHQPLPPPSSFSFSWSLPKKKEKKIKGERLELVALLSESEPFSTAMGGIGSGIGLDRGSGGQQNIYEQQHCRGDSDKVEQQQRRHESRVDDDAETDSFWFTAAAEISAYKPIPFSTKQQQPSDRSSGAPPRFLDEASGDTEEEEEEEANDGSERACNDSGACAVAGGAILLTRPLLAGAGSTVLNSQWLYHYNRGSCDGSGQETSDDDDTRPFLPVLPTELTDHPLWRAVFPLFSDRVRAAFKSKCR